MESKTAYALQSRINSKGWVSSDWHDWTEKKEDRLLLPDIPSVLAFVQGTFCPHFGEYPPQIVAIETAPGVERRRLLGEEHGVRSDETLKYVARRRFSGDYMQEDGGWAANLSGAAILSWFCEYGNTDNGYVERCRIAVSQEPDRVVERVVA